jgi:hypothetical protein
MKLRRTRRLPYIVTIHPFQVFLYLSVILIGSYAFSGGEFEEVRGVRHPLVAWLSLICLVSTALVFLTAISKRVTFSDDNIEYRFFWIRRPYRYEDLKTIRPVSAYNRTAQFIFRDGKRFKVALAYYDADYLLSILKDRSPSVISELATLRDLLTPPRLRTNS